jgi:hypothetical protein
MSRSSKELMAEFFPGVILMAEIRRGRTWIDRTPGVRIGYLTHGRERWYITRFFDDLTYQPDAITQDDLDVYA